MSYETDKHISPELLPFFDDENFVFQVFCNSCFGTFVSSVQIKEKKLGIRRMPSS